MADQKKESSLLTENNTENNRNYESHSTTATGPYYTKEKDGSPLFIPYGNYEPVIAPKPPPISLLKLDLKKRSENVSHSESQSSLKLPFPWPFSCCGPRCIWSRKNGFMIAVTFVVLGAAILLISSMSQNSEYDKTKDFYEGTCKTDELALPEQQESYLCDKPNCSEKKCKRQVFTCHKVTARIHFRNGNYSRPLQIYARYSDIEENEAKCSYKPENECKHETESYFIARGAFNETEFTCYFSSTEPIKILLEVNDFRLFLFEIPLSLICFGILLGVAVKFVGHKCACPSDEWKRKQQALDAEKLELQPSSAQQNSAS